jgi:uncharacterized membrane protein (UPF0136 family)
MLRSYYLIFALVSLVGGLLGFVRARSRPSLLAGAVTCGLLLTAAVLGPSRPSYVLAILVSVLLIGYFGRSYAVKRKAMPAIPMIALSVLCIALTLLAWSR